MARAARVGAEDVEDVDPFDPRRNPHLEGFEEAERTVLEAWSGGRFPHAWLITGPKGVGKTTFAYRLARFVLANRGRGNGAGGGLFGENLAPDRLTIPEDSQTFRLVASGGHPDLRSLTRGMLDQAGKPTATIINVYQTRRVVDFTYQTSGISDWRVVVVDAADDFNTSSANAILKALEEPPSRALFLLVSHAPGGLLPTIRSRCRTLKVRALPEDTVASLLRRYRPETAEEEAVALARLSDGSVGRAMAYREAGGLALFEALTHWLSRPDDPDMAQAAALADRVGGKGGEGAFEAFRDLFDWWMRRVIRALAVGTDPAPVDAADAAALAAFKRIGDPARVGALRDRALARLAQAAPPANLDRRQVIVALISELQRGTGSGSGTGALRR